MSYKDKASSASAPFCTNSAASFESRRESVCCSVLQRVAVCCSALQRVTACCSVLQCAAACCNVLQCVAASYDDDLMINMHPLVRHPYLCCSAL